MDDIIPNAKVLYLISGRGRFGMLAYLTPNPMLEINIIYCLPSWNYFTSSTLLWVFLPIYLCELSSVAY